MAARLRGGVGNTVNERNTFLEHHAGTFHNISFCVIEVMPAMCLHVQATFSFIADFTSDISRAILQIAENKAHNI